MGMDAKVGYACSRHRDDVDDVIGVPVHRHARPLRRDHWSQGEGVAVK
jgi:hypothetical protein